MSATIATSLDSHLSGCILGEILTTALQVISRIPSTIQTVAAKPSSSYRQNKSATGHAPVLAVKTTACTSRTVFRQHSLPISQPLIPCGPFGSIGFHNRNKTKHSHGSLYTDCGTIQPCWTIRGLVMRYLPYFYKTVHSHGSTPIVILYNSDGQSVAWSCSICNTLGDLTGCGSILSFANNSWIESKPPVSTAQINLFI